MSIITYGEMYEGILYGQNRQRHERAFRQFLRLVRVLPLNRAIMRQFSGAYGRSPSIPYPGRTAS